MELYYTEKELITVEELKKRWHINTEELAKTVVENSLTIFCSRYARAQKNCIFFVGFEIQYEKSIDGVFECIENFTDGYKIIKNKEGNSESVDIFLLFPDVKKYERDKPFLLGDPVEVDYKEVVDKTVKSDAPPMSEQEALSYELIESMRLDMERYKAPTPLPSPIGGQSKAQDSARVAEPEKKATQCQGVNLEQAKQIEIRLAKLEREQGDRIWAQDVPPLLGMSPLQFVDMMNAGRGPVSSLEEFFRVHDPKSGPFFKTSFFRDFPYIEGYGGTDSWTFHPLDILTWLKKNTEESGEQAAAEKPGLEEENQRLRQQLAEKGKARGQGVDGAKDKYEEEPIGKGRGSYLAMIDALTKAISVKDRDLASWLEAKIAAIGYDGPKAQAIRNILNDVAAHRKKKIGR